MPSFEHKLSWVSEFPIVCIDRRPPDWEGDVTVENFEGGYKAGRHLTLLGHRTIGIIRGPFNVVTANDRVRGFQKALREKRVELLPEYIHEGVFTQESRSEEHTSELQSHLNLVCRLLLEKKKRQRN